MPYLGGAYNGMSATFEVDYSEPNDDGSSPEYRINESPNVPMTQNGDMTRGSWTMNINYRIGWIGGGEWYNYTRTFPSGQYRVSAAISEASTEPSALTGSMQRITAGANTVNQTVQQLGVFDAPGSGGWGLNNLVPLQDGSGNPVVLTLNGLTTLRFTAQRGDVDYFLFNRLVPPSIGLQPSSQTVVEGQPVTFQVANANSDPVSYQWQSNQVNIAGATGSNYVINATPYSANTARYRCILSNGLGTATSSEAILTVTRDTQRPTIVGALNLSATSVQINYSEAVSSGTATQTGNYGISGGVGISGAAMGSDGRSVILTTGTLTSGTQYTVTVNGVTDTAAIPNTILAGSQVSFIALPLAPMTIGNGSGQVVAAGGGFDVTGSGGAIGGTADQFQFGYEKRTNNFDVRVRVAKLSIPDAFVQAGLMARENLTTGSRFAGVFGSSAQLGAFFESRGTAGGNTSVATVNGSYPVNYPQMWLRLQRNGNIFTGFASFDGVAWTQLGSTTIALPSVVNLGMAVSSSIPTGSATAQFRDYGNTVGGSTTPLGTPGKGWGRAAVAQDWRSPKLCSIRRRDRI